MFFGVADITGEVSDALAEVLALLADALAAVLARIGAARLHLLLPVVQQLRLELCVGLHPEAPIQRNPDRAAPLPQVQRVEEGGDRYGSDRHDRVFRVAVVTQFPRGSVCVVVVVVHLDDAASVAAPPVGQFHAEELQRDGAPQGGDEALQEVDAERRLARVVQVEQRSGRVLLQVDDFLLVGGGDDLVDGAEASAARADAAAQDDFQAFLLGQEGPFGEQILGLEGLEGRRVLAQAQLEHRTVAAPLQNFCKQDQGCFRSQKMRNFAPSLQSLSCFRTLNILRNVYNVFNIVVAVIYMYRYKFDS
jgi:hypothetical protein